MKKHFLPVICALLLSSVSTFAADVILQDAQSTAVNFFKVTLGSQAPRTLTPSLVYTRTETDGTVDFYVFEMNEVKGFVILSATDNDEPVIGYSTESRFPTDFSKIGLNEWLGRWSTELHYVKQHNVIASPLASAHWAAYRQGVAPAAVKSGSVTPFCPTTWDQNTEYQTGPNLYNNFCPGGSGTNQAVTGCVATAMAQIMRYWNYPPVGTLSYSYDDATMYGYQENYGTLSANFADSTFDWANMPAMLTNTSSTVQINAIGRLMSCAGISVGMDYSPNGSGAIVLTAEAQGGPSAQNSYVQYFKYQNIINGIGLSGTGSGANQSFTNAAFIDSIEADLNAGHLVQVEGTDQTNGGHTWVCDGYNTSNQFHMNWGWSGYADGYFAVTSLNPNDGEQLDFTQDIGVLLHIIPPTTNTFAVLAQAQVSAVCPGTSTQLTATTHTGATYSWSPTTNLSNAHISNPVATPTATTTYTVTADSAGVIATSSVTITVHTAPTVTIPTVTEVACYGVADGSATATASGTSGYHYDWSNGQTTATASNLVAGTYTVTVSDVNSCTSTASKTITQPATALSVSAGNVTNATCGQSNGSITATASGGTSTYKYAWSNGATTATISNLPGATYTLTVTDAHSCTSTVSATVTSSGSLHLTTTSSAVTCYGTSTGSAGATVTGSSGSVSYHWSNGATTAAIQNLTAATYSVTISDGSGCSATSSDIISQPAALDVSATSTNAGCGNADNGSASVTVSGGTSAYTYHWSNGSTAFNITGVVAGSYEVTVTDANRCSATAATVISSASSIDLTATSTNVNCYGSLTGSATANVTGATGIVVYTWSNGETTSAITDVAAGTYAITVSDANHCTASTNVSVTQPNQMQVTTSSTEATGTQDNGSATVTGVTGGVEPYTYYWSNSGTTQTINNIAPGNYTVTITDAHGCVQTASDFVNVSTGINTVSNAIAFSVYPNPAGKYVLVQLDELNSSTTLNVRNMLGQTIISQLVNNRQTQLDLSTLADGVYLVELRQDEKASVKQLVVVK